MEIVNQIIVFISGPLNDFAWVYLFLPCAIVGGTYLTIRNDGVQFRHFGHAMKNTVGKIFQKQEAGEDAVTPRQAVTTALSATVGTGNIVGTSQALAMGGYGAVFWMWAAAMVGMCTKYAEIVLAVKYRERDEKGDWVGGPMYYITKGLGRKWKWLAVLVALFAILASFGIGNMSQVNSITGSVINAVAAFTPGAMFGAAAGIVLKETVIWGLRRSVFSNEAGLGSAAIAHAALETKGPVQQGMYGIFEVFVVSVVICTMTALALIVSGIDLGFGTKPGSELITAALATVFGQKFAALFVAIALALFVLSGVVAAEIKKYFGEQKKK